MAWYFRKRVKIFKGVNLNLSKSGMSLSIGPRGAKINISKRGTYLTTGIPGTGIYARTKISGSSKRKESRISAEERCQTENDVINANPLRFFVIFLSLCLSVMFPLLTDMAWWWFFVILIGGVVVGLLITSDDNIEMELAETIENDTQQITEEEINAQVAKDEENINFIKDFCSVHNFDEKFASIAIDIVQSNQWSISQIMRKYGIGYARVGKIADTLMELGIISDIKGATPRQITCENLDQLKKMLVDTPNIDEIVQRHAYSTTPAIEAERESYHL